jgi:hypothetical protein
MLTLSTKFLAAHGKLWACRDSAIRPFDGLTSECVPTESGQGPVSEILALDSANAADRPEGARRRSSNDLLTEQVHMFETQMEVAHEVPSPA